MKKIYMMSIALILLILMTGSALAVRQYALTDAARVKITIMSQDPDPVQPGELLELRWKVENIGGANAENVKVKLKPEYPFSLLPEDDGTRDLGSIQGRQLDEEGVIVLYKLRVDEDAIEGNMDIKLEYTHDDQPWRTTDDYSLRVQTVEPNILIESVKTRPSKIVPGNKGTVEITVRNLADSYMRYVTTKLDLTFSDLRAEATTMTAPDTFYNALPIAPLNSATEKSVYQIPPGETATFTYEIMPFPDAASGIYKVPVIITYEDELETEYTKEEVIGLVISSTPELDVVIDSYDVYAKNTAGSVTIKFVNKGITDIKFLNVELEQDEDYKITSASTDYVGNVDSDDYESADFKIYLKEPEGDSVKIPVNITYKDSNNNDYSEHFELEMKLLSDAERGVQKRSSLWTIIIVVIIIFVCWFAYKRWEKKKNQGKK